MNSILNRALIGLGLALVLATPVVAIAASGSDDEQGAKAASGGDAVTIKGFEYAPSPLTVEAGTKVTWKNDDSTGHTASATASGGFDTGGIDAGAAKAVTLDKPGTFDYICEFHPTMKGSVTVR